MREMGKSLAFCDKDCGDQGPERLTGEDSVSGVRPARVLLLYDASLVSGSSAVSGNRPVHLSICLSVFAGFGKIRPASSPSPGRQRA